MSFLYNVVLILQKRRHAARSMITTVTTEDRVSQQLIAIVLLRLVLSSPV